LIDAFDHENIAASIANNDFFSACQGLLKKDGILIVNLWGGDDNTLYEHCSEWLKRIFRQRVLFLPVQDRDNVIVFGFNEDVPFYSLKYLRQHASLLEQHYQIEFTTFLRDLKKHNVTTFDHFVIK
jgi:spermidine synthase